MLKVNENVTGNLLSCTINLHFKKSTFNLMISGKLAKEFLTPQITEKYSFLKTTEWRPEDNECRKMK